MKGPDSPADLIQRKWYGEGDGEEEVENFLVFFYVPTGIYCLIVDVDKFFKWNACKFCNFNSKRNYHVQRHQQNCSKNPENQLSKYNYLKGPYQRKENHLDYIANKLGINLTDSEWSDLVKKDLITFDSESYVKKPEEWQGMEEEEEEEEEEEQEYIGIQKPSPEHEKFSLSIVEEGVHKLCCVVVVSNIPKFTVPKMFTRESVKEKPEFLKDFIKYLLRLAAVSKENFQSKPEVRKMIERLQMEAERARLDHKQGLMLLYQKALRLLINHAQSINILGWNSAYFDLILMASEGFLDLLA